MGSVYLSAQRTFVLLVGEDQHEQQGGHAAGQVADLGQGLGLIPVLQGCSEALVAAGQLCGLVQHGLHIFLHHC